jgi:glutamate--cysteine ligase catalytic subunit
VQLTDFENAAFALLTVLMTRCMLAMGYNFYIPMSLVEENMRRAEMADAVRTQKFWVRKETFTPSKAAATTDEAPAATTASAATASSVTTVEAVKASASFSTDKDRSLLIPRKEDITSVELTLDEFINGQKPTAIDEAAGRRLEELDLFPGLIPAIYGYLQALGCDVLTIGRLKPYLTLLQRRASGELPTAAQWLVNKIVKKSNSQY